MKFFDFFFNKNRKFDEAYEKARSEAEILLEKYDFIEEDNIVEINPVKPKEDVPIFVSPGWGVTPKSQKEALESIVGEGRKVLTVSFSREKKIKQSGIDIPVVELQKALSIVEALNKKGISKVDAIGHSEGAIVLAIAALYFPEKIRNIVLISPAGTVENDSPSELVKRFVVNEGIKEFSKNRDAKKDSLFEYLSEIFKYGIKNPGLSYEEILACANANIFELTKQLKRKGVKVGFICGSDDEVFPLKEVNKRANKENFDYFISTEGDHGSFIFNKEHVLSAINLLNSMKNR